MSVNNHSVGTPEKEKESEKEYWLVVELLKSRVSTLEKQLAEKDAFIDFLLNQKVQNEMENTTFICNVSNSDIQRDKKPTDSNNKNSNNEEKQEKKKIVVTGDSMLNSVNEKGLSKSHNVKVKNDDILYCGIKYDQCKSKIPSKSVNSVSVGSIRDVRKRNLKRIILGHLNINSIRNKFDLLVHQIKGNVDVMVIPETKLDEYFSNGQFKIPGYALPFRLDHNQFGGDIMVFVREDIPSRVLSSNKSIESLFIELNFRKKKWLLCCTYNPNRKNISSHLNLLRKSLDLYSAEYEHFIIVGDFNTEVTQTSMKVFCDSYEFKNLIKDATCYKNPENPSCIDLILTNNPNSFQNSEVIEAGPSDFHKMTVTVMKTTFQKLKPNIIHYRD